MPINSRHITPAGLVANNPLDRGHPLARGLHICAVPLPVWGQQWTGAGTANGEQTGLECVTGLPLRSSTIGYYRPAVTSTQIGLRYKTRDDSGNAQPHIFDTPTALQVTFAGFSMAALFTCTALAQYRSLVLSRGTGTIFMATSGASGNPLTGYWKGGGDEYNAATGLVIPTTGEPCLGVVTFAPNGTNYLMSVYLATQTGMGVYTRSQSSSIEGSADKRWYLGHDPSNTAWAGTIAPAWVWGRALSQDEVWDLWADPWGMFRRVPTSVSYAPAAGAYTLAAAQGSYALSGQAMTPVAGRLVALAQGAYTLTGQDVALLGSRTLTAAQGSYTLTGQDVSSALGYGVVLSHGSYALSGQDVSYSRGYGVVLSQGSYALTGQDASPLAGRSLSAAQGSYALTGQDVGITAGRLVALAQGAYTLTGQDVSPVYARAVALAQGAYTLTGQDADLRAPVPVSPVTKAAWRIIRPVAASTVVPSRQRWRMLRPTARIAA